MTFNILQESSSSRPCLKYGSVIYLKASDDDNSVVFSDGFVKNGLVVRNLEYDRTKIDFQRCLFEIWPSFNNTYKQQVEALEETIENFTDKKKREYIEDMKEKLTAEYRFNLEASNKVRDTPVLYEQNIQLMHVISNKFLVFRPGIEADIEQENYKVELADYPSQQTLFKISPCFKHQKESEGFIYSGDLVSITSPNTFLGKIPSLHYSYHQEAKDHQSANPNTSEIQLINPTVGALRKQKTNYSRYDSYRSGNEKGGSSPKRGNANKREVNASLDKPTRWRINIYSETGFHSNCLLVGDSIWLNHAETSAMLIGRKDAMMLAENQEPATGKVEFIKASVSDQIAQNFTGNTNGMWLIEHEKMTSGGLLQWEQNFRLKQATTNLYLTVKEGKRLNEYSLELGPDPTPGTLFNFERVLSTIKQDLDSKYVYRDSFVLLHNPHSRRWVVLEKKPDTLTPALSKTSQDDDIYRIFRATNNERWITSFLISCFPVVRGYLDFIREQEPGKMPQNRFRHKLRKKLVNLQNCIDSLEKFCTCKILTFPDSVYGEPDYFRQQILREQSYLSLLAEVLQVTMTYEEFERYEKYSETFSRLNSKPSRGLSKIQSSKMEEKKKSVGLDWQRAKARTNIATAEVLKKTAVMGGLSFSELIIIEEKIKLCKLIYRLITSVCAKNPENEKTFFFHIPKIQYQAKFLREAVECFTSVVTSNEDLLLAVSKSLQTTEGQTYKISEEAFELAEAYRNYNPRISTGANLVESPRQSLGAAAQAEKYDNIILFFLKLIRNAYTQNKRNHIYLQFLRSLCSINGEGISTNQEVIYKFLHNNKSIHKVTLIPFEMDNGRLKIQLSPDNAVYLDECFKFNNEIRDNELAEYKEDVNYFTEQMRFFADLCLGRNFLWKAYVEQYFTAQSVFDLMYNNKLSTELRSIFCQIALTAFLDHEPFHLVRVPNTCRVFSSRFKSQRPAGVEDIKVETMEMISKYFEGTFDTKASLVLIQQIMQFIHEKREEMFSGLTLALKEVKGDRIDTELTVQNYLDDLFVLNQIVLLGKIIRFDLLTLLDKREYYFQILPDLIYILEFNSKNPGITYALYETRNQNRQKIEEKNKKGVALFRVIGSIAKKGIGLTKDLASVVTSGLFGAQKKKGETKKVLFNEPEDKLFYRNPLMKGLLVLLNRMQRRDKDNEDEYSQTSIMIKKEICDLLNFMIDLRQDFLLSNCLYWFDDVIHRVGQKKDEMTKEEFETKLKKLLSAEITSVLPATMKTGIEAVDTKYKMDTDTNIFQDVGGFITKLGKKKSQEPESRNLKFANYTNDFEVPDLDFFLKGLKAGGKISSENTGVEIFPSLMMTFVMANDQELEHKVLDVVMRCFNQKTEMSKHLSKLDILFEEEEISVYHKGKSRIRELRMLVEKSELWLADYSSQGLNEDSLKKVMNLLQEINESLYKTQKITGPFSKANTNPLTSRQNIMSYLYGHVPLINLIRDGEFHLRKAINDPSCPEKRKRNLIELFKLNYIVLISFCKDNAKNQKILSENMKLFLNSLDIELGQIGLLKEICRNNRYVIENFGSDLVDWLTEKSENVGRHTNFLEPLIEIQSTKEGFLLENQLMVLDKLLPHNRPVREKVLYSSSVSENSSKVKFTFDTQTNHDEPYSYHAMLLEVLLTTSKGNESSSISFARLRKAFDLEYLLHLLVVDDGFNVTPPIKLERKHDPDEDDENIEDMGMEEAHYIPLADHAKRLNYGVPEFSYVKRKETLEDDVIPLKESSRGSAEEVFSFDLQGMKVLKPKVIELLIALYLQNDKKNLTEWNKCYSHLLDFFVRETSRLEKLVYFDSVPEDYHNYLFDYVLVFAHKYAEKFLNESSNKPRNTGISEQITKLIEAIADKTGIFLERLSIGQARIFKLLLIIGIDESKSLNIIEKLDQKIKHKITEEKHRNRKLLGADGLAKFKKTAGVNANIVEEKKESDIWNLTIENFTTSRTYKKLAENEKLSLAEAIVNFQDIFPEALAKKYKIEINFRAILRKFISYLHLSGTNAKNQETVILLLQVMIKIIEEAKDEVEMQNTFDSNDATRMLLNVFSDSQVHNMDDNLLYHYLEFGIALLNGGNLKVQKTIFNFCKAYQKTEVMFSRFYSIIQAQIETLQLKHEQEKQNEGEAAEVKDPEGDLKSLVLEKLLRFLQLFTEGHNLDLQNYLRHQTSSRNNYDLVSIIIELLRTYQKRLVPDNYENIMRCLDTLAEFVQGPCPENQIALLDSKFLEFAHEIFSKRIRPKVKETVFEFNPNEDTEIQMLKNAKEMELKRQQAMNKSAQELPPWMIARLKLKVIILVNSLLESRNSKQIVKRIMRSIPFEVLKKNVTEIYRLYKDMYGTKYTEEGFGHQEGDPNDPENDKPPEYFELVTEAGFFIYFLIQCYVDADIQDADAKIQEEIQEIQEQISGNKKGALGLLTNNMAGKLVGQLGNLGVSVLGTGFGQLKKIKKLAEKFKGDKSAEKLFEAQEKIKRKLEKKQLSKEALQFFARNSAHIEVQRNDAIERVYFIVLPFCKEVQKENKVEFHKHVNRMSVKSKVSDLITKAPQMLEIAKHELNKNKIIALFASYVSLWKDSAFLLSILINIFIVGSYSEKFGGEDTYHNRLYNPVFFLQEKYSIDDTFRIFQGVGVAMIVCSTFVVVFFLIKKIPLIIKDAWAEEEEDENLLTPEKKGFFRKLSTWIFKSIKTIIKFLMNFEVLYYLGYMILAFLGLFVHPFCYSFHLTEIIVRYPTMRNVIDAVVKPRQAIILTFILFVIMSYFFTLIGYLAFDKYYGGFCESTYECLLTTIDQSFKVNGGVGGYFQERVPQDYNNYDYARFIYDNFAYLILVIILTNLIAGIIIDTFASLREKEAQKTRDVEDFCFICGLPKEIFDRQANTSFGFQHHIKNDHYMWNYVFYYAYLKEKDPTEYTGIESYVKEKIDNFDISWFPLHKAMALTNIAREEEEEQRTLVNQFQADSSAIKKNIKEISIGLNQLTSKIREAKLEN